MMFLANRLRGAGGKRPFSLTFLGSANYTNTNATISFGSFDVSEDGLVVVSYARWDNQTVRAISSISIGGSNGLLVENVGSGVSLKAALAYREVLAGSVSVSVTMNGSTSAQSSNLAAYLITNYENASPVDSDGAGFLTGTSTSVTLATEEGGAAIFGYIKDDGGASVWSGASADVDTTVNARRIAHASQFPTVLDAAHVASVSWSGTEDNLLIGASWR